MAPTEDGPRKRTPRKKAAAAKKPAPRPARPANGHSDWVDYEAATTSWDPWDEGGDTADEGGGTADDRGLNRTLGEWLEAMVPPEAQIHFFNAGREFAAGIQATVDHHVNRGGEDDDGGAQALRIEIE